MASGKEALVECVPNFSEGVRKDVIDAISTAIKNTEGCTLLLVEPESSANRLEIILGVLLDFIINFIFSLNYYFIF